MRMLALIPVLFIVLSLTCFGEEEPEKLVDLRGAWMHAKEIGARPIKENYLKALIKLRTELTKSGSLGDALLVRAEIEILTQGKERAEDDDGKSGPEKLIVLRDIYADQMTRLSGAKDNIYINALDTMQRRYAKMGNLDAAVAVEEEQ